MDIFDDKIKQSIEIKSKFELLFTENEKLNFINPCLDIKISPKHFIKWLKKEDEYVNKDDTYRNNVGGMCEYSCLYISMLFKDKDIKGNLKIYSGNYGFFDHYWIGYVYNNKEYFIDLTLRQFEKDAPELSIIQKPEKSIMNSYSWEEEYVMNYEDYLNNRKAFEFYTNPKTMKTPKIESFIRSISF